MLLDELGTVISQLPRGLVALICTIGVLWLVLLVYFAAVRPARHRRKQIAEMRAKNALATEAAYPGAAFAAQPAEPAAPADADMPDLGLLTAQDSPPAPARIPDAPVSAGGRRLGSTDVKLSDGSTVHATEALLILRDPRDNRLIVQLGDTGYKSFEKAADARGQFSKLMQELDRSLRTSSEAAETETPSAALADDQPKPRSVPAAPTKPAAPPPSPDGTDALPGDLPKYREIKDEIISRGAFRSAKVETQSVPELNIAAAIEAYLQYKLRFTPEYEGRSIHVLPALDGGVRIEVDGTYFEAVSDVADDEVRAFLQATIHEWQSRQ